MEKQIFVDIGRTVTMTVGLGYDVSLDAFTSQIRAKKDPTSDLIATWDITFLNDGSDGELIFTLDDSATSTITHRRGYMDIKRITGGEPVSVFDEPLEVIFRKTVTA